VANIVIGWSVSFAANMFISIDVPDLGNPETTITGSPNFQRHKASARRFLIE
jgi:hypothetical protein